MALTPAQLDEAWPAWVNHKQHDLENVAPVGHTKTEIRDAIAAADAWADANQASYLQALSGTAFGGAKSTAQDKVRLLLIAIAKRFNLDIGT